MPFEFTILNTIQELRTPALDQFVLFITSLANYVWYVLILGLLLHKPTRKLGIVLAIAMTLQYLINGGILKHLFARVRPCNVNTTIELLIKRPKGFSFPSGHSAAAFCAVGVLYGAKMKKLLWTAFVLACLIAFSRLYLYVHFPTDVLAGALCGFLIGYGVWRVFDLKYRDK
ncbi:MAG: phosphatase PAP2 family protein [Phascolarctobacterium sp.]|nr:phosphatase PAP2 family protein [Phascolarctobacterium sp.]